MARSVTVARRFSLAYVALAALLGVAAGTFALLIERPGPKPPSPWSAWEPTKTARVARQVQIATHVAAEYRLGSGKKLVDVVVRDPQKAPAIQDIALTRTLYPTQRSDIISAVGTDNSAMYILCGAAGPPDCTINEGKPSETRASVLRREALELALYTFRYVEHTDSVLVSFPRKDVPYVVYLTKGDVADQLHRPLGRTLARPTGPLPRSLSESERNTIDELTIPHQYRAASRDEGSGASALYLAPR
jgi:hypothetical protein